MYRWADFPRMAGVTGLYLLLAKLSLAFVVKGDVTTLMCFPSGLALAVLLVGGKKYWPAIWLGAFLSNVLVGRPIPVSLPIATGHALEPLFAVWLLNRMGGFDSSLRRKHDYLRLLVAGIASPWVSAMTGAATLYLAGMLAAQEVSAALLQWWMGGLFGIVLVTPMVLIWRQPQMSWFRSERSVEFLLLFGLAFVCGQAIFLDWFQNTGGAYAEEYLMFFFVAWAGVRFGRHGVQLVILLVLAQGWMGELLGTGHFGADMSRIGMIKLWVYLVEMAAIGVALATVIREKNDVRAAVCESEERFRNMFHKHSSIMLLVDPDSGRIVDANLAASDFYGYAEDTLKSMLISQINSLPEKEAVANMQHALHEEQKRFIFTHRLGNGETRIVNVYSSPVEVSDQNLLFSIVMDITESKKMEQELERRANTDSLTGLPNRRHLVELAEQELARSLRYDCDFSLLLLDVDHFKRINDTYGHKAGDVALQALAEQCHATLREVDISGRFGGEEFAIILPETANGQAMEVAERLRQEIAAMTIPLAQGESLQMTVSIGVATLRPPVTNIDELLQQADKALYAAKQDGRNRTRSFTAAGMDVADHAVLFPDAVPDAG